MVRRDPKEWREALISCNESSGNLASIHNPEEHGFILSQLGYSEYFYSTVFGKYRTVLLEILQDLNEIILPCF